MAAKKTSHTPKELSQATVMVVDDSKFVTDLLTRMLRSMPAAQVLTAPSAEDAFYNLEKNPGLADVMILDYGLGGMDGLRFLAKLRSQKEKKLSGLPVVVLTGHNDMALYQDMARRGISAFLVKPVSHDILKAAIERALQGYRVPKPGSVGAVEAASTGGDSGPPQTAEAARGAEGAGVDGATDEDQKSGQRKKGKTNGEGKIDFAV